MNGHQGSIGACPIPLPKHWQASEATVLRPTVSSDYPLGFLPITPGVDYGY
jgi:hypothetical protein